MIVVSHRGPYRFEPRGDGSFSTHRSAGGVGSALASGLDKDRERGDVDRGRVLRRRPRSGRAPARSKSCGIDLRLVAIDPDVARAALRRRLERCAVVPLPRPLRPRPPAGVRSALPRGVGGVHRGERRVRAKRPPRRRLRTTSCSCTTTNSRSLAAQLRELRPDLRIVHFTHTPFCGPDDMRVLPDYAAEALCARDGEQPGRLSQQCVGPARTSNRPGPCSAERAAIAPAFAASLGPDVAALEAVAVSDETREAARALDDVVGDRLVIARCDRVELSKNIVRGFLAYDRLLEARPGLRGRVVFVAMLYPSRQGLASYLAYASEIEQVVARVNDRWATRDWTPIVLDQRDDFPRSVAAMQRYDVLLVNPIKDGLNLVAKEGPGRESP